MDILEKYNMELSEELDLTDFNIKDVQLKLPSIKHKWVSRLINAKIELCKLKNQKTEALELLSNKIRQDSQILLSDVSVSKQAERNEVISKINTKIEEYGILIDYLERVEKICSSTSFDIKNLIEIKKLEMG